MKTLKLFLLFAFAIACFKPEPIASQSKQVPIPAPVTGLEVYQSSTTGNFVPLNKHYKSNYPDMKTARGEVGFSPTGVFTVYDLQSNGVPQQIWQDPAVPSNVHAVFMTSMVPGFATRVSAYLFSNNYGATWSYLGDVPSTGRSGFPVVTGLQNGSAVIANHNNTNGSTTHTKLYYDSGPGFGVFIELDPGTTAEGDPIWPAAVVNGENSIVFSAAINGQVYSYTNVATGLNPPGTFSGYVTYPGDQANTSALALAPNGTIGHAFIGSDNEDMSDAFYRLSHNGGLSWSAKQKIWDWNIATDSLGVLRGISLVYGNNNQPYVAFNTSKLTESGFFPEEPSQIRVWSPAINGGVAVTVADSGNVPYFPNRGATTDAFLPVCRPSIGKSSTGNGLVVAFSATTERTGTDSSNYFSVWVAVSNDNGSNWFPPDKITPSTPLRDWRFVSVSPISNVSGGTWTVQMVCQSDSLAGTHVNGSPIGVGEFVGIRYVPNLNQTPGAPALVSPPNNSVNVFTSALLDWSDVISANSYGLQVSADSLFTNNLINTTALAQSQFRVDTLVLLHNSKYYWRVNATNTNGTGPWSAVWNFRTITAIPLAPVLTQPPNGSLNVSLTPFLRWNFVLNSDSYKLQISTDSGFSNVRFESSNLLSTNLLVPANVLGNDTTYYWRVSGQNTFGQGPWSVVWSFRTIPAPLGQPALVSPFNGSNGLELTPTMTWTAVTGASNYRLQIETDTLFQSPLVDNGQISSTSFTVQSGILSSGVTYFWRVYASVGSNTGPWSAIWRFSTIISIPGAPSLTSPPNNSVNLGLTPTFQWSAVNLAQSYRIQISGDSTFGNPIVNVANLTGTSYSTPTGSLNYGSSYYWRVNASNISGTGLWSSRWMFSTLNVPPAPLLTYPANGQDSIGLNPTLDWNDVTQATTYRVVIATDSIFENVIHDISTIASSQYIVPNPILTYYTRYYWKVSGLNMAGQGEFSGTRNFRTMQIAPPGTVTLFSPFNFSSGISLTPVMTWNSAVNAEGYQLLISRDLNFNNIVHENDSLTQLHYNVPPNILSVNSLYFWRVRAFNAAGYGTWSSTYNFRTALLGINQISNDIPDSYDLHSNYPNPFNPTTKIRFDLPKQSSVKILLFDITGKELGKVLDLELEAGVYETVINSADLSSGVYFYTMITNEFQKTMRMIVMK